MPAVTGLTPAPPIGEEPAGLIPRSCKTGGEASREAAPDAMARPWPLGVRWSWHHRELPEAESGNERGMDSSMSAVTSQPHPARGRRRG